MFPLWQPQKATGTMTTILTQIQSMSQRLEVVTSKIDQVVSNYSTREDVTNLRTTIEDRFMENKVANERFNSINDRLTKIESQLESSANQQKNTQFMNRNNAIYWIIGILSVVTSIVISLAEHIVFH